MTGFRLHQPVALRGGERGASGLCVLCDLADWDDAAFAARAQEIFGDPAVAPPQHRKLWEMTRAVQSLERFGLLDGASRGLSVAAGAERVLFYLASRVERIVATDIYGRGSFSSGEADRAFLTEPERFAPYAYPRERLLVKSMSALDLRFPDGFFDFSYCLSSIEHFGGVRHAARAIAEMLRVTRPGGVVVVTTDVALRGRSTDQIFSPRGIEALLRRVGLRPIEPIDYSVSERSLAHVLDMRRDDLSSTPHINLRYLDTVFTSLCLVFQKPAGERETPALEHFDAVVAAAQEGRARLPAAFVFERLATRLYGKLRAAAFYGHPLRLMGRF